MQTSLKDWSSNFNFVISGYLSYQRFPSMVDLDPTELLNGDTKKVGQIEYLSALC